MGNPNVPGGRCLPQSKWVRGFRSEVMGKAGDPGSLRDTRSGEQGEWGVRQSLGGQGDLRPWYLAGASCLSVLPVPLPADQAPLVVQVHPTRSVVPQGGPHSLRCQVSGNPPHYFYWSREDGRPLPSSTQQRHQGACGPRPLSHPGGRGDTGLPLPY